MLEFKTIAPRESSLKTIGTVAEFIGEGGYYELASSKNFKNEEKRVSVALYNGQGQRVYVNCSVELSKELRSSTSADELQQKLENIASLPILELPQFDAETKEPIMIVDEETGETKQLVLHSISLTSGADMSSTRVNITADKIVAEAPKRTVSFEDLVAL